MNSRRVALAVAAALAFSLVYLRTSEEVGRLGQDLTYDDVIYVNDAASRLQTGLGEGLLAFLKTFVSNPPHSPFETGLALVGLTVFGLDDLAAYAANGLILLATALFILHFFREERSWVVALFLFAYLTSPFAYRSIAEFRPDLALGMATSAFALLFLRGALHDSPQDLRLAGILLGLALLIKPSFFAHTAGISLWLGGLYLALSLARVRVIAGNRVAGAIAMGLAIAAPYYVLHGKNVLEYFWVNTRGAEAHLWSFDPSVSWLSLAARFTFQRESSSFRVIGHHIYLAAGLCALGMAYLAVGRRWRELLLAGALAGTAFLSVAMLVVGRHDSPFFTATYQSLLLMTGLLCFSFVIRGAGRTRRTVLGGSLGALILAAVFANGGLDKWYVLPDAARGSSWNEALVGAIQADARHRGLVGTSLKHVSVFVTAAGPVSAPSLEWTARKARVPMRFADLHRSDSIDEILAAARAAIYVVIPDPVRANFFRSLPPTRHQARLLEAFRADAKFEPVQVAIPSEADRYHLFANFDELRPVFRGAIESAVGFMGEEGPYPQWRLPRVRWLSSPSARICLRGGSPGVEWTVSASLRSGVEGVLRVSSAGKTAASIPLKPAGRFEEVSFALKSAEPSPCLDLTVEAAAVGDGNRLVLFRKFEVAP